MRAMVLARREQIESNPLEMAEVGIPEPETGEVLIRVELCGVCRTDLHVAEGDLPPRRDRIVPGHEVVGRLVRNGKSAEKFAIGSRLGVAWLHKSCGVCSYCHRDAENLCQTPQFTGYDVNGGYAEYVTALEEFVYPIPQGIDSVQAAPLLCAGIIGYRALVLSCIEPGQPIGLYGFGASAHVVIQIARYWGCDVYVATRGGEHEALAKEMGAVWTGPADAVPPVKLRSAILFAPAGELVLPALDALDKGGTLAVAGIYLSPIPKMDYTRYLFNERNLRSVTANTRRDGYELMRLAAEIPIRTHTQEFPLEAANEALQALKHDQIRGAAALRVWHPTAD